MADDPPSPEEYDTKSAVSYIPASSQDNDATYFYESAVPECIDKSKQCILGIDEAGRGPVLGPMVYAVSYCTKEFAETLKDYGFADSKVLNESTRATLMEQMCSEGHSLHQNLGWAINALSARDISALMLDPNPTNLNEQARYATISLIQRVAAKVNVSHVYIDTVGPPQKYEQFLQNLFPHIKIIVAKKADSTYPIVSAASVCAKVTRDGCLELRRQKIANDLDWGCGYSGDARTVAWLAKSIDPMFGWDPIVRYSWGTIKDIYQRKVNCVTISWKEEIKKPNKRAYGQQKQQPKVFDSVKSNVYHYGVHATSNDF
ncbi:hypothetical protein CANCADRAFT_576 [Tortispora caseinolytica NRRL Y-17796]|uniref:Ribonuclease n=1 Tax=Tortispora caseinolytica NRRL Y-17796 TaxID=767744 RepID=A0A1E4TJR8_9ASCO|nr:hypothetical protein CANCADRAFT_576 [Tortispora caseinolytica NRRL Y-17796]